MNMSDSDLPYPKVSVALWTYNHEQFIAQAIESVLMQQTDFEYELIIGEDCSTDGTRAIVVEYFQKYPERIRPLLHEHNVGGAANSIAVLNACRGQYVALLDGDDYWTDPRKLQKQVNFLEAHPEYSHCFHPVFWLEHATGQISVSYYGAPGIKQYYTLDDLLEYSNFVPTASVVFRSHLISEIPDWFSLCPVGDLPLHILNLCNSGQDKVGFIDEPMAVYRRHSGGVHGGNRRSSNSKRSIQTYLIFGDNLGLRERVSFRTGVSKRYIELSDAYRFEQRHDWAIFAAYQAVKYAPGERRKHVLSERAVTLMPRIDGVVARAQRVVHLGYRAVNIFRNEGILGILSRVQTRLAGKRAQPPIDTQRQEDLRLLAVQVSKDRVDTDIARRLDRSIRRSLSFTSSLAAGESIGAYKYASQQPPALLYASAYACMVRHLAGDLQSLCQEDKTYWANYINGFQSEDGLFRDPLLQNDIAEVEDWWGWRHLSAHVLTALTALGGKTSRPFSFLQFLYQPGQPRRWISNLPWREKPDYVSNTVMNYGVMLQYDRDFWQIDAAGQALEEIFQFLDETQDPASGLWGNLPAKSPNELSIAVQTAYHLWNLYFYDRRPIHNIERAIDSCLATQNELGGYGVALNSSACEDIDSIDPLCRFYFLTDYRREDIRKSLERALPWVLANQLEDGGFVFSRFRGFAYGHERMTTGLEESHLFGTWFRTLSIAYICQVLDLPGFPASSWHWVKCPGYQFWHTPST